MKKSPAEITPKMRMALLQEEGKKDVDVYALITTSIVDISSETTVNMDRTIGENDVTIGAKIITAEDLFILGF